MLKRLYKSIKGFLKDLSLAIFSIGLVIIIGYLIGAVVGYLAYKFFGILPAPEGVLFINRVVVTGLILFFGSIFGITFLFAIRGIINAIYRWCYWIYTGRTTRSDII